MKRKANKLKLDLLVFGAHPDDVEACAGGFVIKAVNMGKKVGIIDLTRGEMSNYGTVKERTKEAKKAQKILGACVRECLDIPDEHVTDCEESVLKVTRLIRKYKPETILAPYFNDLHPDHSACGQIVKKVAFFAKIKKYEKECSPHQIGQLYFYMLHTQFEPTFVLDISNEYKRKMKALYAHQSQLFKKKKGKYTKKFINEEFMEYLNARAKVIGYQIGVTYGEPYLTEGLIGLEDPFLLLSGNQRSLTKFSKKI